MMGWFGLLVCFLALLCYFPLLGRWLFNLLFTFLLFNFLFTFLLWWQLWKIYNWLHFLLARDNSWWCSNHKIIKVSSGTCHPQFNRLHIVNLMGCPNFTILVYKAYLEHIHARQHANHESIDNGTYWADSWHNHSNLAVTSWHKCHPIDGLPYHGSSYTLEFHFWLGTPVCSDTSQHKVGDDH